MTATIGDLFGLDLEGEAGPPAWPAAGVRFFAYGTPRPKGKLIMGERKDGSRYQRNVDNGHSEWKAAIGHVAAAAMVGLRPLEGPVRVEVTVFMLRPKGHYHTGPRAGELRHDAPPLPAKAPDADKLMRAVGDALTGVCYRDDALISTCVVKKRWGAQTGAEIVVSEDR